MSGLILTKKQPGGWLSVAGDEKKIYSMEELCYYLYQNVYAIDLSFFDEEFFGFLQKMGREKLVEKLNMSLLAKKHHVLLVLDVLRDVNYYSAQEVRDMEKVFADIMNRTPAENVKVRADALKEKGDIRGAKACYEQLVSDAGLGTSEKIRADAWNNIGVIYAEGFLYEEALSCFRKALEIWQEQDYLDNVICALIMAGKSITDMEMKALRVLKETCMQAYGITEETFGKYEEVILREEKNIACSQETLEFKEQISPDGGKSRAEYYANVDKVLEQWKTEYRVHG